MGKRRAFIKVNIGVIQPNKIIMKFFKCSQCDREFVITSSDLSKCPICEAPLATHQEIDPLQVPTQQLITFADDELENRNFHSIDASRLFKCVTQNLGPISAHQVALGILEWVYDLE